MNRQLLDQHFAPKEIRQREGGNGKTLDYVEGHAVITRLNEAFDGNWNFEVTDYGIDEDHDEVRVLCKLTAEGITKMQFGSSSITRNKKTKEAVSIGDDLKKCATDALKKCATLFGVGLHLYGEKTDARPRTAPRSEPTTMTASTSQASTASAPPTTPGRLSSKQHSYLLTLSRGHGLTRREVDALCIERFGVVLDHLSRSEASLLIEEFNSMEAATPSQAQQQPERQTVGGVH